MGLSVAGVRGCLGHRQFGIAEDGERRCNRLCFFVFCYWDFLCEGSCVFDYVGEGKMSSAEGFTKVKHGERRRAPGWRFGRGGRWRDSGSGRR